MPLLRDIRPEEYARAGELLVETYRPYVISPAYLEILADVASRARAPGTSVLGAFDQDTGELLGTTVLAYAGSPSAYLAGEADGELRMLTVAPSARRRGIGSALVHEAGARSRLAGRRRLILGTMSNMPDAHRLYESLGFTRIDERAEAAGYRLYVYAREFEPWPAVRAAGPGEYERVGEITVAAYADDGLLPQGFDYAAELRDAKSRAVEAELYAAVDADGEVLGGVTYCPDGSQYREVARPGEGEFRMLAVARSARGRGVGEALVRGMLARAREDGRQAMAISSAREMAGAHRLYERLGFRRAPDRDWEPIPGTKLLAYTRPL